MMENILSFSIIHYVHILVHLKPCFSFSEEASSPFETTRTQHSFDLTFAEWSLALFIKIFFIYHVILYKATVSTLWDFCSLNKV